MKKIFVTFLFLLLLMLSGCAENNASSTGKQTTAFDAENSPITGDFSVMDLGQEWLQTSYSKAYQTGDNVIIEILRNSDNIIYCYNLSSQIMTEKINVGNISIKRICDDKIILGNQTEFWAVDAELAEVSERVTLPEEMFVGMADFAYQDAVQYTVSADMQKIIYDNPVTGLNYYDLQTGEVRLLFNTDAAPYYYNEYYGNPYRGPDYLSFLPGDDKFYFFSTAYDPDDAYGIWVCDLQGNKIWQTASGDYADYWGDVWRNRGNSIFYDVFIEEDGQESIHRIDLDNQSWEICKNSIDIVTDWAGLGTPVYSNNYFAYIASEPNPLPDDGIIYDETLANEYNRRWKIKVVELGTGTIQEVLSVDYGWDCRLLGITDNGQVIFTWQVTGDTNQFIAGITERLNQ